MIQLIGEGTSTWELNCEADGLANLHKFTASFNETVAKCSCYRLFFDGSVAAEGCGGGWILYGSNAVGDDTPADWLHIASLSFPMSRQATITACEFEACLWGVAFVAALLHSIHAAISNLKEWNPLNVDNFTVLQLANLVQ